MADYIERRRALDILHEIGGCGAEPGTWADGYDKAINEAYNRISREPAADVAPVVHNCGINGCAIIREAAKRLAELERKRTAMQADLKRFGGCMGCKGYTDMLSEPCLRCDDKRSAWEWRGEMHD